MQIAKSERTSDEVPFEYLHRKIHLQITEKIKTNTLVRPCQLGGPANEEARFHLLNTSQCS